MRYFVTPRGLADAFNNPEVLNALRAVLTGHATMQAIQQYLADGLIGEDRRGQARIDHNILILSGAIERLRSVAPGNGSQSPAKAVAAEVKDLRTVPRKLYRLSEHALSKKELERLPSGARRVYAELQRCDVGTIRLLAENTGLNRRTVENAISSLRKVKAILDFDFER